MENCHYVKGFCKIQDIPRSTRHTTHVMETIEGDAEDKKCVEVSSKEQVDAEKPFDMDKDIDDSSNSELWLSPVTGKFELRSSSQLNGAAEQTDGNFDEINNDSDFLEPSRAASIPKIVSLGTLSITKTQIYSLDLSFCSKIANDSLKNIAHHCPCLSEITLRGCYKISDMGMINIIEKCPRIRLMDISGGSAFGPSKISDRTMDAIAKHGAVLDAFIAGKVPMITLSGVKLVLKGCRRLQKLTVSCSDVNMPSEALLKLVTETRERHVVQGALVPTKWKHCGQPVTIFISPSK